MTYIAPGDEITLKCVKGEVKLRFVRVGDHKIRLAIDAGKDVAINKGKTKKREKK